MVDRSAKARGAHRGEASGLVSLGEKTREYGSPDVRSETISEKGTLALDSRPFSGGFVTGDGVMIRKGTVALRL